ncbi:STM4011 family radical SAM protein [Paenibacillus sp. YN15]|uniref:STM4011 family radical SAM protein n=1 Tax=Paenibacillus sp. YN15 TaxID=1742774 RepID=UPI000DCBFAD0|nr:STM4011 family radical SAM protein [Paenibacillus sp. YN15]RAU99879.1 radical SAM protein [Paenibacillus sp. YN15]
MRAVLYYRGALSSCNYDCPYCPFGKKTDSAQTLARDREQLSRFVDWAGAQGKAGHRLKIFFNPYGEGLIHRWYQTAMTELSHMEHVDKVAIQTNLSAGLAWTEGLNPDKAAFWATYHPGQVSEAAFLARCGELHSRGIPFSVGAVGVKSAFEAIASLRRELPADVYLWVNAFKDQADYYLEADRSFLGGIDPHFEKNLKDYESCGKACQAGESVFYVQGFGLVKRCYQDRRVLGHLYREGLEGLSRRRPCGMTSCGCYIGYIHLPELRLADIYGERLLERIAKSDAGRDLRGAGINGTG